LARFQLHCNLNFTVWRTHWQNRGWPSSRFNMTSQLLRAT
jgi:hypothetical protein